MKVSNNMKVSGLKKDRLLRRCELLMVRGVDSPTDISEQLNISYNSAKSFISIIRERWADSQTIEEIDTTRRELIKKTEAVIAEGWKLKNEAKNVADATNALRVILAAVERLQRLYGVDEMPPLDKPQLMTTSEMAQKFNTTLSPEAKQIILDALKKAIKLDKKSSGVSQINI